MITFGQARRIILQKIGPDCGLIEESIAEKPYGWYFMYQSNQWLQTRDPRHLLVGSGGFIVEREDGHLYQFGSAYSLERNFAAYEYGLNCETYDLVINQVHNFEKTLDLLLTLDLTYVIPEFAHGRHWRIPQYYERKQLAEMLRTLPCTFANCHGFYFKYENFLEIDKARCCSYKLRGKRDEKP